MSTDEEGIHLNSFEDDIESRLESSNNFEPTGFVQRTRHRLQDSYRWQNHRYYAKATIIFILVAIFMCLIQLTLLSPVTAEKVVTFVLHITDVESKERVLHFLINATGLIMMTIANASLVFFLLHWICYFFVYSRGEYLPEGTKKSKYETESGWVMFLFVCSVFLDFAFQAWCIKFNVEVLKDVMYINSLTFSSFVYFVLLAAPLGYRVIKYHRSVHSNEVSQSLQ